MAVLRFRHGHAPAHKEAVYGLALIPHFRIKPHQIIHEKLALAQRQPQQHTPALHSSPTLKRLISQVRQETDHDLILLGMTIS